MDVYQSPKIVFPHIMKTGGTTVNNYLHGYFHEHEVLYDASTWEELGTITFAQLQQVKFVRGHFEHIITDTFGPQNGFEMIGLLRHPVQRVISHYWHMMKAPDIDPAYNFIRERNLSIEEFLNAPECAFMASNYQVSMYGADERVGAHTMTDKQTLRKAKEHIDRCCVVGVTEEIETFIHNLAEYFGFASAPPALGKSRSYAPKTDLSDELLDTIKRLNMLDMELYDYAVRRISKKKIKPRRKISPLTIDESGFSRWSADQPFAGIGWSDLQQAQPRHKWSISNKASLNITRKYSGGMLGFLAIDRFVSDEQEDKLSVFINEDEVSLRRWHMESEQGRIYFFKVPPSTQERVEMRFELDHLISFAQVDPNSTSHLPRGFALTGIGFDPLD